MKRTAIVAGVILTLFSAGCSQAPDPKAAEAKAAEAKAKDTADIKALEDKFTAAVKAKDVNAVMAVYVPDESLLVFDAVPPRQYKGAATYRKDWEETIGMFPGAIDFELNDLDVTAGGGDLAYAHSIQHMSGMSKDKKKIEIVVRVTDVYKKVNGQWLIAHEHVSFPTDIATGKADLMSKP
jgi:uncharacterized protein (TIGR02246 family)